MNRLRLKLEPVLYAVALLLALALRLVHTGQVPLDNREAELALQALSLSRGEAPLLGPQPAYLVLTALNFFLFSAGDWSARFWPALSGSLLVLLPLFYRERLGHLPALLMAFFLALDPGMLAISRQAGSLPMALFFTLLTLGLWLKRRDGWAGIAAGLALLSGPGVWPGVLGLAAAIWVAGEWGKSQPAVEEVITGAASLDSPGTPLAKVPRNGRRILLFALATVFFVGTLFFSVPNGLSAAASSLPAYLSGWVLPAGVPAVRVFMALLLYEFLPLIFGLWGAVEGVLKKDPLDRFLLIWWAVALLLVLAYPARQVADLVWALLPLWALAARKIVRLVRAAAYDRVPVTGTAILTAVILGFVSLTLASMANNFQPANQGQYFIRLGGAAVMLAASAALIAWGWSRPVALKGLSWGLLAIFGLYTLANSWNAAGLSGRTGGELWSNAPASLNGDLMVRTIADFREWGFSQDGGLDIVVAGVSQPALRWTLRNFEQVSFVSQPGSPGSPAMAIAPAIVIAADDPQLALPALYRGQRMLVAQSTDWNQIRFDQWWRWLVFRKVPDEIVEREQVILWARADLFPGGELQGLEPENTQP